MSITSNNLKVRELINQVVNDPEYKKVSHVPLISGHQIALISNCLCWRFWGYDFTYSGSN
jgi:hypothetical protein